MNDAMILCRALATPESVTGLTDTQWTALLCMAHAERLAGTLAYRVAGLPVPPRAAAILENARLNAEAGRTRALWEVERMRRALAPLGVPVVLLKGSAFVAAGLNAGQGRLVGDLDILVPRAALPAVEAALLDAGWEWLKHDAYDDAYYRRWMHELPPLIHRERDAMIDVHHTILPLTAKPKPDPAALFAESVSLGNDVSMLSAADMIVHAVAHLLADGDLSGGLRNLWDIDRLLREYDEDGFMRLLRERAEMHGLRAELEKALYLSIDLYGTPIATMRRAPSKLFRTRILARDGWGRETHKLLRFAFYLRSHLIRMPLPMLLRHLAIKWWKARRAQE